MKQQNLEKQLWLLWKTLFLQLFVSQNESQPVRAGRGLRDDLIIHFIDEKTDAQRG